MKRLIKRATLAAALAGAATGALAQWQAPTAAVQGGTVRGTAKGGVDSFLGIPFAAPPVGELRWRAPQPVVPWKGVRPAQAYGNDCMQVPFPSDAAPLGTTPAEDCLTVNVWRPAGAKPGAKLPVMVWIYGGGSVNGGASPAVYAGDAFAHDGVVMVSFNWRVGRFGFFGHPALTTAGADGDLRANFGYMDSIAALKWVQGNVAAFGGDPAKVTIYGQSAGAGQVAMLLASPLSQGLFRAAIIQSGGGVNTDAPAISGSDGGLSSEQAGLNFAKRWGIEGSGPETLARLRALSADQVTDGIHMGTRAGQAERYTGPVTDGRIVRESLVRAAVAGREAKVPLLIGSTTADNANAVTAKSLDQALATTFAKNPDQVRAAFTADRSLAEDRVLREMSRDMAYNEPARYLAGRMTAQGLPVYRYSFGYVADSMRKEWAEGPPHATDIPYSMDTVAAKYGAAATPADQAMARTLHAYWVNFVKTGNPNGAGLARWDAYKPETDVVMTFAPDGRVFAQADPHKARLDAIAATRGR